MTMKKGKNNGERNDENSPLVLNRLPSSLLENINDSPASVTADDLDLGHGSKSSFSVRFRSLFDTTESERLKALEHEGVGESAFLIRDAMLGSEENPAQGSYSPYNHPHAALVNTISVICRRLCAIRAVRHSIHIIVAVMMALTFFEPPPWCRSYLRPGENSEILSTDETKDKGRCKELFDLLGPPVDKPDSDELVEYYPNSVLVMLKDDHTRAIEAVCLFLIWFYTILRIGRDGCSLRRYFRPGKSRIIRILEVVSVFWLTCDLIYDSFTPKDQSRNAAPFLRVLVFISCNRGIQSEIKSVWRMFPEVRNVLILLFILIAFYAWLGVVAFDGSVEGKIHFPDMIDAMWTLWIMSTTANYPDVMIKAYDQNRISSLYFIFFMLITFFFLINLILASIVNAYENIVDERRDKQNNLISENLSRAFDLMDHEKIGYISKDTVMSLFLILNEDFPELRKISPEKAKLLFAVLDQDGSNEIDREEFMHFANVLRLEFEKVVDTTTYIERNHPNLFYSPGYQRFCAFIRSTAFEYTIDVVLVLNAVIIYLQSHALLAGVPESEREETVTEQFRSVWEIIETIFTVTYCLECIVKIMVDGWDVYIRQSRNVFDFTITIIAVLSTIYIYSPTTDFSDPRPIKYIVMTRVLRLGRLLTILNTFNMLARISIDVLSRASSVLLLQVCSLYVFAALGVIFFGGLIMRDPADSRYEKILETDFAKNDLWDNNFNDMIGAFNVLFSLLIVSFSLEGAHAIEVAADTKWTRLFFLVYYIFGIAMINNLVIAFIISAFINQWDYQNEAIEAHKLVGTKKTLLEGRHAVFDSEKVTGTSTKLHGRYVAKLGRASGLSDMRGQQAVLEEMFTGASTHTNTSKRIS